MSFLAKNNFDFNTLFRSPINYARISDFDSVYEKCVFKVAEYSPDVRIFEALSTANMRELDRLMQVIEEWVYNPKSDKRLELTILSAGVRKQLDRRIKDQYNASGMFFHYSRASTSCRCEKTKRFKQ